MCIAFVGFTVDSEHLTKGVAATGALGLGRGGAARSFIEQASTDTLRNAFGPKQSAPDKSAADAGKPGG